MDVNGVCRACGGPLSRGVCPTCNDQEASREIHRDIILLTVLTLLAIGLFVGTRWMANSERRLEQREANAWYVRGSQELRSGQVEPAIESYRRALGLDRNNRGFALSLAGALAAGHHLAEANEALLRLRESDPEDAEIDLALARLNASSGDINDAVHYYQNALYGRWTGSQIDARRTEVRFDLIHLLLEHNERSRAISELLILAADAPPNSDSRVSIARLFLQAGDAKNALKYFEESLHTQPHDAQLLEEAGRAAFDVGEYAKAQRFLSAAEKRVDKSDSAELLAATRTILDADPLAPHMSKAERKDRLLLSFDEALKRASACIGQQPTNQTTSEVTSLSGAAENARAELKKSRTLPDSDAARSEFEIVFRLEEAVNAACGEATGVNLGLVLLGRRHLGAQ